MLEPPDLTDEVIVSTLRDEYGIRVSELAFLPIGSDSDAWTYRVDATDGIDYFLKVRRGVDRMAGLVVPRHLQDLGVPHVVGPLKTMSGRLRANAERFTLIVYPFIGGRMAADAGPSIDDWRTLGVVLKRIHGTQLVRDLTAVLGVERFTPSKGELIAVIEATIGNRTFSDPAALELASFWELHREEIRRLVHRAEAFARRLENASLPLVLCHADLHTWNMLLDSEQSLWIVDWDETILAPKERDLMFVLGGIAPGLVRSEDEAAFLEGYGGDTTINQVAIAYYRYAWAVQDIAAFGEQAFLVPALGAKSRRAAAAGFKKLFEPGHIVDLALASGNGSP